MEFGEDAGRKLPGRLFQEFTLDPPAGVSPPPSGPCLRRSEFDGKAAPGASEPGSF